jgi:RNA polymerase sigma-70 factor (ECF subfamily)
VSTVDDFDRWLRDADGAFADALRSGLDVNGTLARIKSRAETGHRVAVRVRGSWDPGDSVADAVDGDPEAVERLLRFICPLVLRYCRARIGGRERSFASADDVAQEVCLAVLTALPSYRDEGRPFLAFVYGIAQHKVADVRRAAAGNRTEPVAEVPDEVGNDVGPEQEALRHELHDRMSRLLSMLPVKQREIVVLRVVVGLSAEETAEAVGSTPGAVRVAQHRALARLRQVFDAEEAL